MTNHQIAVSVGSPDPELNTSPIAEETGDDFNVIAQQTENLPSCYFNSQQFLAGKFVCSGSGELLRCHDGIWIREGTCDPENI